MSFTLEIEGLDIVTVRLERAFTQTPSNIQAALEETAHNTVETAKALASARLKNPGTYLDSFYISAAPLEVRFGNMHKAARIIESGSIPHEILPVARKALRFEKEGAVIFARRVFHPGTQALWILSDAFREELSKLMERMKEAVQI